MVHLDFIIALKSDSSGASVVTVDLCAPVDLIFPSQSEIPKLHVFYESKDVPKSP